ncbi:hypothetical protein LIA77_03717 [Sarocladium implicatum]|nr:hypothetical protein LIA77_03717 [Sarocladium implicatum]
MSPYAGLRRGSYLSSSIKDSLIKLRTYSDIDSSPNSPARPHPPALQSQPRPRPKPLCSRRPETPGLDCPTRQVPALSQVPDRDEWQPPSLSDVYYGVLCWPFSLLSFQSVPVGQARAFLIQSGAGV